MNTAVKVSGVLEIYKGNTMVYQSNNLIVNGAIEYLHNLLIGDSSLYTVAYLALGTGVSSTVGTMTGLEVEGFRKGITNLSVVSGEIVLKTLLEATDANGTWTEAGLFLSDGSLTLDTGTLFSRIKLSPVFVKDGASAMVTVWKIKFSAV